MAKKYRKLAAFYLCSLCLTITESLAQAQSADTFFCVTDSQNSVGYLETIGTVKAVAIYACGSNADTDTLPDWWTRVWDTAQQHSIPRFYKDNSVGQYIMLSTPYGRDGGHCFKASIPFGGLDSKAFCDSIMAQADVAINFANFDGDGDDTVDAFFFVVVNHGGSGGRPGGFGWITNDISVNGRNVIIPSYRSTRNLVASEPRAVFVCSHEWGHLLASLTDVYSGQFGPSGPGRGVGSFSVMGNGFLGLRTFPFDPYSRMKLGWVTPINVTAPLYGQSIPDYLTTGTVYRLAIAIGEYFLVTNHWGTNPPRFWEDQMPGRGGLMIWHVYEPAGLLRLDCELAHGMWNRDPVTCSTTTENRFYGEDSLDLRESPCGYAYPNLASATCWWNDSTKTTFDGLSNPSSDYYGDAFFNGIRTQDRPTHLAVRKIQAGNKSSATADLLVNNWFGHITANTTWGPNKVYAITGDLTVDSGKTLTIDSCTNIHFQANEDNQKSIPDTGRSAIVVQPGGKLIVKGTRTYPVMFLSSKTEAQASTEDWRGIVIKPGGVFACSNAVIRHAYAGIEDSSRYLHTIQNVRIGRCTVYGILAVDTDSLTIRGCRADSVYGAPGGYGIGVSSQTAAGAKLIADTAYRCWDGIVIVGSGAPVDSCFVGGDSTGSFISNVGIYNSGQGNINPPPTLSITNSRIDGYFATQHFLNAFTGRASLTDCDLNAYDGPPRSPTIVRNSNGNYLKIRRTSMWNWGLYGVVTDHNNSVVPNLGRSSPLDSGNNDLSTSASGSAWKFVWDSDCGSCTNPQIRAEYNQWYMVPPSSRFSNNVDRVPYLPVLPPKLVAEEEKKNLPKPTDLFQNYPNPFNPTTLIQFNLEKAEKVNLEVFNILGQKVRTLLSGEEFAAGPYSFIWDGKDNRGSPVSSGVYFYKLQTSTYLKTKKMMLVK